MCEYCCRHQVGGAVAQCHQAVLWHGVSPGGAVARCVTRWCCGMVCHQAVLWHGVSPGGAVAWCVTRRCCGMVCHQVTRQLGQHSHHIHNGPP
ncbi:hypothetical protein ACOMHN_033157 [Nucella lapillus]